MTDEALDVPLAVPNKGGRPRILTPTEAIIKQLGGLGRIQCTTKEGAAWFGVTEPTFLKFLTDFPEAAEVWTDGKAQGRISLRRTQLRLAEKNANMAIFLGKNLLGQKDRTAHEHSGPGGGPIPTVDLTALNDEELDAYERLCIKLAGSVPHGQSGTGQSGESPEGYGEEPI